MADVDEGTDSEERAPAGLAARSQRLVVVLAALLVIALVVAAWQWQRAGDLEATNDQLAESSESTMAARTAAAEFMRLLFTYDHETFDQHEAEVLAGGTDRFDQFYLSSLDAGTRESVASTEAVSTATVDEAWVGELAGNDVTVVVRLDTDNVSLLGRRQLQGAWFRVLLERHDGAWLVDEFTNVLVEDEAFDPADGSGGPTDSPSVSPAPSVSPSPSPAGTPTG